MKLILAILFIIPTALFAQECKLKKEVDGFTHEVKLTTGFMPLSGGMDRVLLSIDANSKDVDFFFAFNKTTDPKCFDDASTAVILFDSSKVKGNYKNTGSMNCEGLFHITFKNSLSTASGLKRLATAKVASIQLTGRNKKPIEIVLSEKEKQMIMDMTACMVQESKTLLKKP